MSVCDIIDEELVVVGSLEVLERTSHLYPGVPCPHPEKLRRQFFDLMTEDDRHSNSKRNILRLHEYRDHSVVLVACQFSRLFILDESKMEMLLSCLLLSLLVLIVFDLFVELFSVDLGDVLHHDCDVSWIEGALRIRRNELNIWGCMQYFRRLWFCKGIEWRSCRGRLCAARGFCRSSTDQR